jgi:acetoin utilization protein AcuB
MRREVVVVREHESAAEVCDRLQEAHVHGAPVIGDDGRLVGFVSQEDILFGSMGAPSGWEPSVTADFVRTDTSLTARVRDIMTAPAVSATEETSVQDLCMMMWRLHLHHIPIVRQGRLKGIVSSLDLCRAVAHGMIGV